MKRDMDLIRRIVLATADLPAYTVLKELEGVLEYDFALHAQWLNEAGMIVADAKVGASESQASRAFIFRLTWSGCEFADAIRNDTMWAKAKDKVIKPGMSFTFEVLKDWLAAELSQGFPTLRKLQ